MEQTIGDVIKEKCFNCHDKGTVSVTTHSTRWRDTLISCPICQKKAIINQENKNER